MSTKIIFVLLILTISIKTFSQEWVDKMFNPEVSFFETQKAFNQYWNNKAYEKGKGYKQYKRWEYFMQNRVNENGFFTETESAYKIYYSLKKESQQKGNLGAGNWKHLGPFGGASGSGAGRLNCITYHPTNANILIAGAASGGIWITTNGGLNWSTNTDHFASLAISDIVYNPLNPNIVYAASGDRDAADAYSIGVLKSTDGGYSWDTTALIYTIQANKLVNRLAINPINPDIIYAATSAGIFKTFDAGLSWKSIRPGAYKDIAMKPGDTNTIYIATDNSFMRSTTAGLTWSNVSIPFLSPARGLRIGVTPADPNYVYIMSGRSSDNGFGGIFLSTDAGATFTVRATTPNLLGWKTDGSDLKGQSWYDLAIAVSPTNKNYLFVGGVNVWKSVDGGLSWNISGHWTGGNGTPYVHADIHELKYSPHSSSVIWASSDGGAYKATSNGLNWTEFNEGLSIGQIYKLGASANDAGKIMTGWQDNGSNIYTSTGWSRELGGDGMECIIDPTNSSIMYGSLYYGAISRTTNNGADWKKITDSINEEGGWVTPYVLNPKNPKIIIAGYDNIWKTTNRGDSWKKISNFTGVGKIVVIAIAPSDTNVIYIASQTRLFVTLNGGINWTSLSGNLGSGNYTGIAINPTNASQVWITKSGYFPGSKVYTSSNAGTTWTNVSGNLPNIPANCLVYENGTPNGIYVGMDVGIFYIDSTKSSWVPFMKGLPNVVVDELEIFYPTHKIRAATYGRGLWESDVISIANGILNTKKEENKISVFPNPSNSKLNILLGNDEIINSTVEIFNSMGQKVGHLNNFNSDEIIDISSLKTGVYFLKIVTSEKIFSSRFVKSE